MSVESGSSHSWQLHYPVLKGQSLFFRLQKGVINKID